MHELSLTVNYVTIYPTNLRAESLATAGPRDGFTRTKEVWRSFFPDFENYFWHNTRSWKILSKRKVVYQLGVIWRNLFGTRFEIIKLVRGRMRGQRRRRRLKSGGRSDLDLKMNWRRCTSGQSRRSTTSCRRNNFWKQKYNLVTQKLPCCV